MVHNKLISVSNMSFTYKTYINGEVKQITALKNIDLDIYEGEILLVMGPSGCGKTTLVRCLKKQAAPEGIITGKIENISGDLKTAIVFSNPETQLVTTSVLSDLSLAMEYLGYDADTQKKRISETVSYFGIEDLLHRHPDTLSGGQKQIVALCSQLILQPDILLVDEPISQLDPISALEFLDTIRRLNEELGITIVMTEHRPDDIALIAHRMVYMEEGSILYSGTPRDVFKKMWLSGDEKRKYFLPAVSASSLLIDKEMPVALSVKELKLSLKSLPEYEKRTEIKKEISDNSIISIKEMFFAYEKEYYALRNMNMNVYDKEFLCIMGSNGSGKSTLLKIMSGILKPYIGKVKRRFENIQYMPQHLNAFFIKDSVREQMEFKGMDMDLHRHLIDTLNLEPLLDKHPYDLSSGEQQKAVVACMLLRKPDFIILDEPTKSMDPSLRHVISHLLVNSKATVVCATHDLDFAANYATRCAMLFNGEIAYSMDAKSFFKQNRYYTTPINRAFSHLDDNLTVYGDILRIYEKV